MLSNFVLLQDLFKYFDNICHGQKATDFRVVIVLIKETYQISHCTMFASTWPIMKTPWRTSDDFDSAITANNKSQWCFFFTETVKDHVEHWIPFLYVFYLS